ncbi:MAG: DUF3015 family protein [Oligoflexales bacterium]|nr:DUF3015 family protein [Oligoflexales bacterium]
MRNFLILFMMFSLAMPAFAQKKKKKKKKRSSDMSESLDSYTPTYHMAGCGLGSLVIKDDGIVQVLAVTTNGTFGSQTFGITSGTSNCVASPQNTAAEREVFLDVNYVQLKKEAAQGQGDVLHSFAELLGCERGSFVDYTRAHYQEIFTSRENVVSVYEKVFGEKCVRLSGSAS